MSDFLSTLEISSKCVISWGNTVVDTIQNARNEVGNSITVWILMLMERVLRLKVKTFYCRKLSLDQSPSTQHCGFKTSHMADTVVMKHLLHNPHWILGSFPPRILSLWNAYYIFTSKCRRSVIASVSVPWRLLSLISFHEMEGKKQNRHCVESTVSPRGKEEMSFGGSLETTAPKNVGLLSIMSTLRCLWLQWATILP